MPRVRVITDSAANSGFLRSTVNLKPGMQTLDGREALALARTRHQDNDIKRGERQQMILEAIIKKASSISSLTKYDDILAAVGNNMKTNMTFGEMKSLAAYLKNGMPKVDSLSLKGYDDMSTGVYYYKLDNNNLAEIKQTLQNHLGLTANDINKSKTNSNNNSTTNTNTTNTNSNGYGSDYQSGSSNNYSGSGSGNSYNSNYNSNNNSNNNQ